MKKCKKYKPQPSALHSHHRSPEGNCQTCVYFSQQNCGSHVAVE